MYHMAFGFLMFSLLYLPASYACRTDQPPTYKVHLSYDKMIKNDVVVELTEVESDKKEYLLDDTGYLGAYLAFARLTTNKDTETIKFFRERLERFKNSLMPYDNGLKLSKKLKELSRLLDRQNVTTGEMIAKWQELKGILDQNQLQILARQKLAQEHEWSTKEINLDEIRLPEHSIPNSRGCSGRLIGFQIE